ncbi:plant cysteine oxidase 1-like isoform X1 [Nymphaea colorata]|nr:plant cysteine oxidase 1-like isoform X1 [Nymphaea colorata]
METTKLQRLFDACNEVFTDEEPPSYRQIQWLRHLLDSMEALDVGINEFGEGTPDHTNRYRKLVDGQSLTSITYIHIYESEYFSMGIFCFPAGASIPFHDHPGMTVLSKLLYGSMYHKAYDWVLPTKLAHLKDRHTRTVGLAGLAVDEVLEAPCQPSVLFPRSGGNIHSFTALTPSAILDVLSPPYNDELGRPSTYFYELPIRALPGYAVLEERDLPEDLTVEGAPYLGPKLTLDAINN